MLQVVFCATFGYRIMGKFGFLFDGVAYTVETGSRKGRQTYLLEKIVSPKKDGTKRAGRFETDTRFKTLFEHFVALADLFRDEANKRVLVNMGIEESKHGALIKAMLEFAKSLK